MRHIFNESAIPVKLLTFMTLSFNETRAKFRIGKHLIYYMFIFSWNERLLHHQCFKPCFRLCLKENPVISSRIQTEWGDSSSYYVHENALDGIKHIVKKITVNV